MQTHVSNTFHLWVSPKKTFTNASLWKFRCWSAVYACSLLPLSTTGQLYHNRSKCIYYYKPHFKIHATSWFHLATECIIWITKKKNKKKCEWCSSFSTAHKAVSITFTNCLESDILKAVAPKKWARRTHRSTHLDLYTLKKFPNNTKK